MQKEIVRLKKLITDHYDGQPWIGISLRESLQKLPAQKASEKTSGLNSIWEIVNHLISWREAILEQIKGKMPAIPENNFFHPVEDVSEEAWQKTLKRLDRSQHIVLSFLQDAEDSMLNEMYPTNGFTFYELLHGIVHHDAYHLGQIRLLMRLLQA